MALLLREDDVVRLLPMQTAMECLEFAFNEQAAGRATVVPRTRLYLPKGGLHLMSAAIPALGVAGFKAYTWFVHGTKFLVNLYSSETGELLALMEADRLGQIRTGAASGLATQCMARANASTIGIFGTGFQAQTQLEAICLVRKIQSIRAYGRDAERRKKFCDMMERKLNVEVHPVDSPEKVLEGSDIVVTATTARTPLFDGKQLAAGVHVNAIGGNAVYRREIDEHVVARAEVIAVDSREQAKEEAGELLAPMERGMIYWERVDELHEVVSGKVPGRRSEGGLTLFKSLGIALEDIAVAAKILERAREAKIGEKIKL